MTELPKEIDNRIRTLSAEGDALAEKGDYSRALQHYWAAWQLLPEPQSQWEAATWLLGANGDAY